MYSVYLDKFLVPIPPEKISYKIKNQNKTLNLISGGEVNCLKSAGLTDIEFSLLLPNCEYPFAVYKDGFKRADYFLEKIEKLKTDKKPFQFIVIRNIPGNKQLYSTNIKVSLEDYSFSDDVKEGTDVTIKIKLRQYKEYGVKALKTSNGKITNSKSKRQTNTSPAPKNNAKKYTVVAGDCLWTIAKKFYGDGAQWEKIYKANTNVCGKPYTEGGVVYSMIYPGDVLTIPV